MKQTTLAAAYKIDKCTENPVVCREFETTFFYDLSRNKTTSQSFMFYARTVNFIFSNWG
jgi:hypothetical protein